MSLFDRLPPETINLICDACNVRTLKLLRPVSHAFHDLVTPIIFRDVWLGLFDYSLDNLRNISQSDRIGKHVKRIVVCGAWMRACSMNEWKSYIDVPTLRRWERSEDWRFVHSEFKTQHRRRVPLDERSGDLTSAELRSHWEVYQSLAQEQRKWLYDVKVRQRVQCFLQNLVNLESIELPDGSAQNCYDRPEPFYMNLWSRTLILTSWMPGFNSQDNVAAGLCLMDCFSASKQKAPAQRLSLSLSSPKFTRWFESPSLRRSWDFRIHEPFRYLTELDLDVEYEEGAPIAVYRDITRVLADWIRSASHLTKLNLVVGFEADQFRRHMAEAKLPKLRELEIGVGTDESRLLGFLADHATTLKSLHLSVGGLRRGSWGGFFRKLPSVVPQLKSISATGPLRNQKQRIMTKYNFTHMVCQPEWFRQYRAYFFEGAECPTMQPLEWFQHHKDELYGDGIAPASKEALKKAIRAQQSSLGYPPTDASDLDDDKENYADQVSDEYASDDLREDWSDISTESSDWSSNAESDTDVSGDSEEDHYTSPESDGSVTEVEDDDLSDFSSD